MTPINEEVAIKQEILEISLSSLSGSPPRVNVGSSGKKRRRVGPEKKTAVAAKAPKKAKAPRTAPKPGASSSHPNALSNKLTIAQKDALRLAFIGHISVPSLVSRNGWASANNLKGEAVHRYCRYLRDRSNQILVKQEPDTAPRMEAEWQLSVNISTPGEKECIQQVNQGKTLVPTFQTGIPKAHQPDFPVNLRSNPSMAVLPHASEPSLDTTSYLHPVTLQFALKSVQMPDFSFLSNTRFFDLLTGPGAIVYGDLHDPIMFCMKFQDSYCSLDMEVAHEALRTMYFFEDGITSV
jgi:hypothetical protein